jgi:MATE family multidrug resistance protein
VLVAARHGTKTLAAIGIANGISAPIFLIGLGLLLGISPTLSHKRGQSLDVSEYFYTCIIYSLVIGLVFMLLIMSSTQLVGYLGFDKDLVPMIKDYLFLISFSCIGAYLFHAVKEYLQATEHVVLANAVSVVAVFANVALCYLLVFGVWIFPEMGVRGLAYATIIIRSLMGVFLFIYSRKYLKPNFSIVRHYVSHVFKFSLPISISIFTEVLAFSVVMIMIGRIGSLYAAIHSIALNLASTTYMIPLAISSATSVKIAYFYGRNNFERIRDLINASLIISMTFMAFAGLCLFMFPGFILSVFTTDLAIITAGIPIIIVCAMFQIFDGAQVTLSGILRGFGITRPTFVIVLIGYWIIGLPLGYYLGYMMKMNALGFWIGLAVSLLVIAIIMFTYLSVVLRRKKI